MLRMWFCLICLPGVLLASGTRSLEAAPPKAPRIFDSKLFLDGVGIERSPVENARNAAKCIRLERKQPSEGDWRECSTRHHSVLDWMLRYLDHDHMRDRVDRPALRLEMLATEPGEAREVLMLTRGLLGDPEVGSDLSAYLADARKPPYLRALAA